MSSPSASLGARASEVPVTSWRCDVVASRGFASGLVGGTCSHACLNTPQTRAPRCAVAARAPGVGRTRAYGLPKCGSIAAFFTCPRGAVGQRAADGGAQRCTFTHQQWLPHNFEPNGSPPGCSRHRSLRRHTFADSHDERACVRAPQPPSQPMAARALAMPQGCRLAKLPARLLPSAASTRSDPWPLPVAVERSLDASGF
jgi:hypothetical protein